MGQLTAKPEKLLENERVTYCVAHTSIDCLQNVPGLISGDGSTVNAADIALGVGETENEQAQDRRHHDSRLEPKEPFHLIGPQRAEGEVHTPKQEEGQHA